MKLAFIPLDLIDSHPDNPRLFLRENVVEGIRAQIEAHGFEERHAPHVRELDGRYQLISGHQRTAAARLAALAKIPCVIVEMDDETAFRELLLSNAQGELSHLEIGLHVLKAVPKGKPGPKGKNASTVMSQAVYAERLGKKQPTLAEWICAARVFNSIGCPIELAGPERDYTTSLTIMHRAPESDWVYLAAKMLAGGWTTAQTERYVEETKALEVPEDLADIFPRAVVLEKYFLKQDLAQQTILKIAEAVRGAEAMIGGFAFLDVTELHQEIVAFRNWLREQGAAALDVRAIRGQLKVVMARLEQADEIASHRWNWGEWKDHVDGLADNSVSLVLTDPPYGMDYYGDRSPITDAQPRIRNDESIGAAVDQIRTFFERVLPKLKDDCHVLVFCNPEGEPCVAAALQAAGLTMRRRVIWVKDQLGLGDVNRTFAPKHEVILHAVKGDPLLLKREPDVIEAARVTGERALHPAEKPLALLERLIEATTVAGELVVDPFAGVASTLVAAKRLGRAYWGCELEGEYFDEGQRRLLAEAGA